MIVDVDARFPKRSRLSGVSDYQTVFNNAKRLRGVYLTLLYCPNELPYSRVGLAISNKHAGNVVRRNGVKRQIREYFRLEYAKITGLDLIVLSKKELKKADIQDIKQNLQYFKRKLDKLGKQ